jgi:hypothetical protein
MDVVFYGVLEHVHGLRRFGGIAIGVEIGLLCALIAFALSLFGEGWKRWTMAIVAVASSYIWFSWLMWLVQMEC